MELFEQYHHYSQNLLLAQHEVSEIISHNLTKGEVREDFIIQYLAKSIQNCEPHLKRGFIKLYNQEQSGQADIILVKKFAEIIDFGNRGNVIVNPEDCLMVIEVKSTLKGTYLNEFNTEAKRIKDVNPNIVCGMFAYTTDLAFQTIMERCGYEFDKDTYTYYDSPLEPLPLWYSAIDFVLLLDKLIEGTSETDFELQGSNQLYISKTVDGERYFKGAYAPAIRNLVALVKSLLKG